MKSLIFAMFILNFCAACGPFFQRADSSGKTKADNINMVDVLDALECDESRVGKIVFARDQDALFICESSGWKDLGSKDGINGINGANGINGINGINGAKGDDFDKKAPYISVRNANGVEIGMSWDLSIFTVSSLYFGSIINSEGLLIDNLNFSTGEISSETIFYETSDCSGAAFIQNQSRIKVNADNELIVGEGDVQLIETKSRLQGATCSEIIATAELFTTKSVQLSIDYPFAFPLKALLVQ